MKEYKLLIKLLIISLFVFLPLNAYAERNLGDDEGSFDIISEKMYEAFDDDYHLGQAKGHYYVKWLQNVDGDQTPRIAYCGDYNTPFTYREDFASKGADDIGIQYIIKNGFTGNTADGQSYHYSTNDNCEADSCPSLVNLNTNYPKANAPWYVNYWLTQMAIWIYQGSIDEFSGSNLSENRQIIMNLVNGAKAAKASTVNFANVDPHMAISNNVLKIDGDYYYSELITASDVGETFNVSVSSNNYEVVDVNKNIKATFNNGDKFYIRVLKSKVVKNEEVTITLSTEGVTYANKYLSANGSQQLSSYIVGKTSPKTTTLKLNTDYACDLTVTVTDSVTKEKICGGSFAIYDENGNLAKDNKGKEIGIVELSQEMCQPTFSLPEGKYRVVQQTSIDPYLKDENEYQINTETQCPLNVELKNEKLYQIRILKINGSEDNPIAGAKLKLEDSNGNIIKEFISSTEPQIIDKLHAGTYYLSEVEAPNGYSLSDEKITIEVNNENYNKLFTFNNDEIIVPKTDFNSTLLGVSLLLGIVGVGLIIYAKKKRYA